MLRFLEPSLYCAKSCTFGPEENAGGKLMECLWTTNVVSQYHTYFLCISKTFGLMVTVEERSGVTKKMSSSKDHEYQ